MTVSSLAICMRATSEMRAIWVAEVHNWIFRIRIITERKWHIQTKAAGVNKIRHINLHSRLRLQATFDSSVGRTAEFDTSIA